MVPERYIRQLPLVKEDGQFLLAQRKILIVGCGGLGGNLIENMLRIGVGSIVAADGDRFEASNLNRQILSTEQSLGCSKAEAAAARANAVNRQIDFRAVSEPFTEKNGDILVSDCDLVLDGLDNIPDRLLLEDICAKHSVPIVHGAILGELIQVAVVPPGSGILHALYAQADSKAYPKTSIAYTPACCAAVQCAQAVRILLGQTPILWGKLLQLNLETMEQNIFPFV